MCKSCGELFPTSAKPHVTRHASRSRRHSRHQSRETPAIPMKSSKRRPPQHLRRKRHALSHRGRNTRNGAYRHPDQARAETMTCGRIHSASLSSSHFTESCQSNRAIQIARGWLMGDPAPWSFSRRTAFSCLGRDAPTPCERCGFACSASSESDKVNSFMRNHAVAHTPADGAIRK